MFDSRLQFTKGFRVYGLGRSRGLGFRVSVGLGV